MADPHPSARFGQAPIRWTAERRPGADPVVAELVAGYLSELRTYMPDFDPTEADPPAAGDFDWPSGTFVVVMASGEPAGCGGIRRLADEVGELRRMWVRPAWRTVGAGRLLLTELEAVGREMGLAEIRLDPPTSSPPPSRSTGRRATRTSQGTTRTPSPTAGCPSGCEHKRPGAQRATSVGSGTLAMADDCAGSVSCCSTASSCSTSWRRSSSWAP